MNAAGKSKIAIVVPLDGSETAAAALGAAEAMAAALGGMLHIVHVARGRVSEDRLLGILRAGGLTTDTYLLHQLPGEPVDAILGLAKRLRARMIVMSSHGVTYDRQRLVGRIAMGILGGASVPVLVVRPGMENLPTAGWHPDKALCPLDGSPQAASHMELVFGLAKVIGFAVDVVHVWVTGVWGPAEVGALPSSKYQDYPQHDMVDWEQEFYRRFFPKRPPDVEIKMFHQAGDPVGVMIEVARREHDDLIVLTWHGRLEKERARIVKGLLPVTEVPVLLMRAARPRPLVGTARGRRAEDLEP